MLLDDQDRFAGMVAGLIVEIRKSGYKVSLGDCYRDARLHGDFGEKKGYGAAKSFHKKRLAIDINLFKDGRFLSKTEEHKRFGEYWESLGGTWGGRFNVPDGNHYSFGE
ncbi:MAG: M15 family metallopeptidase [Methylococcaceae bacterium]|nr:M15 family metallopeptidase [Methylococcaceae bacterium]